MANLARDLQEHLDRLKETPSTPINERLVEDCSHVLPAQLQPNDAVAFIKELSALVPTLPQDPTVLNSLLVALLEPFSFSDILGLSGDVDFVSGLDVKALPYNRLLLSILSKATLRAADAATVAGRPEIIPSLVTLWLSSPDAGVGQKAGEVFYSLLAVDHESHHDDTGRGQGLVWRRVFRDRNVYALFYSLCTYQASKSEHELSRNQRTLAQSRLLEVLPGICDIDWDIISKSHASDVEEKFMSQSSGGLLDFVSLHMVDTTDDVLMHKCLVEYYSDLIKRVTKRSPQGRRQGSLSLDYLAERSIHQRIIDLYTDPDEKKHGILEIQFLYSSAANYVATYALIYPRSFVDDEVKVQILKRLNQVLDLSPGDWIHRESPKHDLHVLASLPRAVLVPRQVQIGRGSQKSVISFLPTKQTNSDALHTLANILNGPVRVESLEYPDESPMMSSIDERNLSEAQHARVLYYLYVSHNPRIFADLVGHADSVALTETALAAIHVLKCIANANWAPLPAQNPRGMSEGEFANMLPRPTPVTPTTGVQALLAPPSLEHTLPYLLKPTRSFANLVGGRGDSESVAYKVALGKFETLRAMYDRLKVVAEDEPGQGYEEILKTLQRSIARGPWSQQGDVGGRIATLDM